MFISLFTVNTKNASDLVFLSGKKIQILGQTIVGKFRHRRIINITLFFSLFTGNFGGFSKFLKAIELVAMVTLLFTRLFL